MRLSGPIRSSILVLASAVLPGTGCSGACSSGHPYVPYSIDSSAVAVEAVDAAPPPSDEDAGGFGGRAAAVAVPGLTRWEIDGLTLDAPEGDVFVLGLTGDFDADGAKDAFAVVRSAGAATGGEVVFYKGGAGPARFVWPDTSPADAGAGEPEPWEAKCAPIERLAQIGRHSVYVEVGEACPDRPVQSPARRVAVLGAASSGPVARIGWLVYDPPGAPTLTLDADGSDVDGDGIDDVALRVTLEGGSAPFEPGPRVSAVLRWLDRPAGLSRDVAATEASFVSLAQTAALRATRAQSASAVPLYVAQVRGLWAAVCAESRAPRLVRKIGPDVMTCGKSRALEEVGLAEVRAWVTTGDALRAITALDRAELPPAAHTPARVSEAETWIAQVAPLVMARGVRTAAAVPLVEKGRAPAWGPLAFEASGKLLIRTGAGVVRVDPAQGDESAADDVPSWKSAVLSPDGTVRWIEAYDPCDGVALRATFAPTGDGTLHDVALPIAPPLGARCTTSRGEPAAAVPLAWGPAGLEAIVASEPILVAADYARAAPLMAMLDLPVSPGSPRSPDGKTAVFATTHGLLVRGPRTQLVRAPALDASAASSCTVSNDATKVACVVRGRVLVGWWEQP